MLRVLRSVINKSEEMEFLANQPEMKNYCGTGAVATGTSPLEVRYGLSRRAICDLYHVGQSFQADMPPRLNFDIFSFFWKFISQFNAVLVNSTRVDAFEFCSLEPWFLPRIPADFFPHEVFSGGFFWPLSDSSICVNCRSALSFVLCRILRSCIRLQYQQ